MSSIEDKTPHVAVNKSYVKSPQYTKPHAIWDEAK